MAVYVLSLLEQPRMAVGEQRAIRKLVKNVPLWDLGFKKKLVSY